jgi:hypothetical protein
MNTLRIAVLSQTWLEQPCLLVKKGIPLEYDDPKQPTKTLNIVQIAPPMVMACDGPNHFEAGTP